MKAMILCAGRGLRMRHLSLERPKPLLEVRGRALLLHHLYALKRAGVEDVIMNLGYLGEQIPVAVARAFADDPALRMRVHYSQEDPVLETGGGVARALPLLGPDPFIVLSADVLTDFDFSLLPRQPKGLVHLVMVDNPSHHARGDYALMQDRLSKTGSLLNFAGIGVYHPALFAEGPSGAFPLSVLFEKAIAAGQATGQYYAGLWHNIGTPEQLDALS